LIEGEKVDLVVTHHAILRPVYRFLMYCVAVVRLSCTVDEKRILGVIDAELHFYTNKNKNNLFMSNTIARVLYFVNPQDNVPYFMTGTQDTIFTPLSYKAMGYTITATTGPFSFMADGVVIPLLVSTRKDLTFRNILVFEGPMSVTPIHTPGDTGNTVNGVRYRKAILDDDGLVVGEGSFIEYLQFPNNNILFRHTIEDVNRIVADQRAKSEVYEGKVSPAKGAVKHDVVETLDPIIKISIYVLVIIAVFILFAITRSIGQKT
jgi:hypothetical protein